MFFYRFTGLFNNRLYRSLDTDPAEKSSEKWLRADFMRGGLVQITPSDPFDEDKGESRSMVTSMVGTPLSTPTVESQVQASSNTGRKLAHDFHDSNLL